jgi:hypothetical protein
MTVDSRSKGQRGEYLVRDLFRKHTGLGWERTPQSGALSYLKTDIYLPNCDNAFAIEVKNYEEQIFDSKIFTNKSNYFVKFWDKVQQDASTRDQEPLLVFKHNRSKLFLATRMLPKQTQNYMHVCWLNCYVLLAEEWLEKETTNINWIKE